MLYSYISAFRYISQMFHPIKVLKLLANSNNNKAVIKSYKVKLKPEHYTVDAI